MLEIACGLQPNQQNQTQGSSFRGSAFGPLPYSIRRLQGAPHIRLAPIVATRMLQFRCARTSRELSFNVRPRCTVCARGLDALAFPSETCVQDVRVAMDGPVPDDRLANGSAPQEVRLRIPSAPARLRLVWSRSVIFVLMVVFAFTGQYYFARLRDYLWDGVFFYTASALCLAVLARGRRPSSGPDPGRSSLREKAHAIVDDHLLGLVVWGGVAVAATWIVVQVRGLPDGADHYPIAVVWLVALGAAALAAYDAAAHRGQIAPPRGQLGPPPKLALEGVAVAALLLAAFLLRWINVGGLPANFGGDEGSQGLAARAILEGKTRDIFGVGWFAVPNLFFSLQALSMRAFGDDVYGLRMLSVLIGTASVGMCYLLVRRLLGVGPALAAATLLASYHFNIHFSRLGSAQIGDAFFVLAPFYFLLRGFDTGRRGWFIACGVVLGLTQYFYFGARLVPLVLLAYIGYLWVCDRASVRFQMAGLVHMTLIAILVALPYLAYCSGHPGTYLARVNQVGIFQSGWYSSALSVAPDPLGLLSDQALRSLFAFNYFADKTYWYHPGIPLLDFFSSVFFVLGLICVTARIRQAPYFILGATYWLGILFGAFLTENPPSSMRLVILSPLASIFVAVGMQRIIELGGDLFGLTRTRRWIALASLVVVASVASAAFYFWDYSGHRTEGYGGPNTEVATEMARYLVSIGTEYEVYFFGAPRMYLGFATLPFVDRGLRGIDVKEPLRGAPGFIGTENHSVLVFLPERRGELDIAKGYLTQGREEEIRGEGERLLFVAYRVDR